MEASPRVDCACHLLLVFAPPLLAGSAKLNRGSSARGGGAGCLRGLVRSGLRRATSKHSSCGCGRAGRHLSLLNQLLQDVGVRGTLRSWARASLRVVLHHSAHSSGVQTKNCCARRAAPPLRRTLLESGHGFSKGTEGTQMAKHRETEPLHNPTTTRAVRPTISQRSMPNLLVKTC